MFTMRITRSIAVCLKSFVCKALTLMLGLTAPILVATTINAQVNWNVVIVPAAASSVTFFDDTFPDADWTAQKFLDGSFTAFQVTFGGNPGDFRETDHSIALNGQSIFVVHTLAPAIYDPSVSGAIAKIDFSFDVKFLGGSMGTSQVGYRLALVQDGSIYYSNGIGVALGPGNGTRPD